MVERFDEIGAQLRRPSKALLASPAGDGPMIAGEEHARHLHAAIHGRSCVLGIFQKTARERLVDGTFGGAQNAGKLAHHRIDDDHRREFAGGEDVIAQRDNLIGKRVNALVDDPRNDRR